MKEFTYSVLLVSQFNKFNETIKGLLDNTFDPLIIVSNANEARRLLLERKIDIVVVNTPLKDELGVLFAIDASTRHSTGVLVLANENIYSDVYHKTNEFGILTISKPTSKEMFLQSLRLITSTLEKINISKNNESKMSMEDRMKEIRIINEAKLLLMKHKHYTEDEVHKWLAKTSMDLRIKKIDLAKNVIEIYHKKDDEVK